MNKCAFGIENAYNSLKNRIKKDEKKKKKTQSKATITLYPKKINI